MKLPVSVLVTVHRYLVKFPIPQGVPGEQTEAACRAWAIAAAEQVVFSHPNAGYGMKRADPGRPISKDTISNNQIVPGKLVIWDLILGSGTGQGVFVGDKADALDVTGQVFVPVQPVNHLGDTPTTVDPPPPVQPDWAPALAALTTAVTTLTATVDDLVTTPPTYTGTLFGYTITLRPKDGE